MSTAARGPAGEAARSAVRRMLGTASLEPPGLPPAALLVVRSLADPLPGRMGAVRGGPRVPGEWESAVRGALADRWRHAARPAHGPVSATADAVFFADTAEMIAAFARDAVAGAAERWWWRALLKGLPGGPVAVLAALWAREARHLPAAVEQLSASGDAARVLAALSAPQVARILAAVAWAWDAPGLLAAPSSLSVDEDGNGDGRAASVDADRLTTLTTIRETDSVDADRSAAADPPSPPKIPSAPMAPPWRGFLPPDAVPRGMPGEAAALLGLSLMLHRAPQVARGTAFVARFARWRAEASASPSAARPFPASPPSSPAETRRASAESIRSAGRGRDRRMEDIASAEASSSPDAAVNPSATHRDPHPSTDVRPRATTADAGRGMDADARGGSASPDTARTGTAAASDAGDAAPRIYAPTLAEARAASAACGVFFLVNVLRSMDFHRAVDTWSGVEPVVGGWGWIELVARALLGPRAAGLADDPVWRLLAALDGRAPDEPVGRGFVAPRTERLPDAWIDLFGGEPPAPAPSPPLGVVPDPPLQRFLDLTVPVIRARITGALAAAGGDPEEPLETSLLCRKGTVELTRAHVDVWMGLHEVTLPIRLAGLDATPGFVPALSRVVTLHFA